MSIFIKMSAHCLLSVGVTLPPGLNDTTTLDVPVSSMISHFLRKIYLHSVGLMKFYAPYEHNE